MNILSIIENIEKLIVGILFSIIYLPKTLCKIITKPLWVPVYIDSVLQKKTKRFDNYISPVILYIFSSLVLFVLFNDLLSSDSYSESFIEVNNNDQSVMATLQSSSGILIGLAFLGIPLLFAVIITLFKSIKLNRAELKRLLYIQCYYFSPFSFSVFLLLFAIILVPDFMFFMGESDLLSFFVLCLVFIAFLWIGIVQIKFIRIELKLNFIRSSLVLGTIIFFAVFTLYGGIVLNDIFSIGNRASPSAITFLPVEAEQGYIVSIKCHDCNVTEQDFEFKLILKEYFKSQSELTVSDLTESTSFENIYSENTLRSQLQDTIHLNSITSIKYDEDMFYEGMKFSFNSLYFNYISLDVVSDKNENMFVDVLNSESDRSVVGGLLSHQSMQFWKIFFYVLTSLLFLGIFWGFRNFFKPVPKIEEA